MTNTGDTMRYDGKRKLIWVNDNNKLFIKHKRKLIEVEKKYTETMTYYDIKEK